MNDGSNADVAVTVPDSGRELASVVVEYDDGPDRCTVYPPDATGVDWMSTWISADRDAFVDLERKR